MNSLSRQALLVCAFLNMVSAANAQQSTQPKFSSAGIKVEINRAEVTGKHIFIGLVLTNNNKETLEIISRAMPTSLTSGVGVLSGEVSGVLFCEHNDCREQIGKGEVFPTQIDPDNYIVVIIDFSNHYGGAGDIPKNACSTDVTMPILVRTVSGRNPGPWREIRVGLPNISMCPKG